MVVKVKYETYRDHLDELQMTIYNLKARIERLKTQLPKWIPVNKRLPKDGKTKVVTLIDGSTEAGYYSDGEWWCIGDYMALDNRTVIAWMELPEASIAGSGRSISAGLIVSLSPSSPPPLSTSSRIVTAGNWNRETTRPCPFWFRRL